MKERRQRSDDLPPERFNPNTADGFQKKQIQKLIRYGIPTDEIEFAVCGVISPKLQNFWNPSKPIGVHKALRKIINMSFPEFISLYSQGLIEEDLDSLSDEALFHSIFKFMLAAEGKGLRTNKPGTIRSELGSAWDRIPYLSANATSKVPVKSTNKVQQLIFVYRSSNPQLKNVIENLITQTRLVDQAHQNIAIEFANRILRIA